MAAISSVSPRILDGGGPGLFSGYTPRATSTAGLPPGPDPHLLAEYVFLFFFLVFLAGFLVISCFDLIL